MHARAHAACVCGVCDASKTLTCSRAHDACVGARHAGKKKKRMRYDVHTGSTLYKVHVYMQGISAGLYTYRYRYL